MEDSRVAWGASMHRFGSKFDHGLLQIRWKWKLRLPKQPRKPDYKAMTTRDWDTFDVVLEAKLKGLKRGIQVKQDEMGAHYDEVTRCIKETIAEVIPKLKPKKFNGRTISAKTKALYEQRIRDSLESYVVKENKRMFRTPKNISGSGSCPLLTPH